MKKILLLAIALVSIMASAQVLEVASVEKLNIPQNADSKIAGISPDGSYVLITSQTNKGLQRFDLASKQTTTITKADGAGYNVQISQDGQEVVYRETKFDNKGLRKNNIIRLDMATAKTTTVAKAQRDMMAMTTTGANVSVSISDRKIALVKNGKTILMAPNGTQHSYIWPSVSPDGSKICYYVAGKGCFVANIDGSNPLFIARACRAAKWYNNNTIVAMADEDDGKVLTASAIVLYTLDGKSQILVGKDMMAIYPFAVEGKIAFSTAAGEMYLMQVK